MTDALTRLADAVRWDCNNNGFEDAGFDGWAELAYHGSLDAAKALHEAVLPDYGWGAGSWGARVWLYSDRPHWDGSNRQEVEMVNAPARAWLLAIIRALAQVQPTREVDGVAE
jgi:hypothetical protein